MRAARHAVQGFNDSLRAELHAQGTNVGLSTVHMPALDTPQFGWVRTRLPNHPQPVPPIHQTKVGARAVLWAAEHAPREVNVGGPTIATPLGDMVASGLLDRYLGWQGIDRQQTDDPIDQETWRDNLFEPVDAEVDYGPHGIFDRRATDRSAALWAVTHKGVLADVAAGIAAVLVSSRRWWRP